LDADLPRAAPDGGKLYARTIADRLHDRSTCVLVAEEDHQVVGYVLGVVVDLVPDMFVQESGGFLADIYVDKPYRGRGIGRALVESLGDWFREKGLRHFEWHVASANTDGIAFWQAVHGRSLMIRMRADLEDKA
jgi:GNAT superfamily N-acetyltransferase